MKKKETYQIYDVGKEIAVGKGGDESLLPTLHRISEGNPFHAGFRLAFFLVGFLVISNLGIFIVVVGALSFVNITFEVFRVVLAGVQGVVGWVNTVVFWWRWRGWTVQDWLRLIGVNEVSVRSTWELGFIIHPPALGAFSVFYLFVMMKRTAECKRQLIRQRN